MTAVLSPVNDRRLVELSSTMFRKQVLPKGTINYKGRKLVFDEKYLTEIARTFRESAFDQVPFQLADADNKHTMDPVRFAGEIKGFELTKSGLDMLVDLTPDAADLVRKNKKLGVSARILEGYTREADGKSFGRVVQHVLGTLDPRVTGMGAWQEVALAEEYEDNDIIDVTQEEVHTLSDTSTPAGGGDQTTSTSSQVGDSSNVGGGGTTTTSTKLQVNVPAGTSHDPAPVMSLDDMDFDDVSDEELETAAATLSHSPNDDTAITLAAESVNTQRIQQLEIELAAQRFVNEARQYIDGGVPPALVEIARPILSLPMAPVVDLSNGDHLDVGQVIRSLLDETRGFIELGQERGYFDPREDEETRADAVLDAMRRL